MRGGGGVNVHDSGLSDGWEMSMQGGDGESRKFQPCSGRSRVLVFSFNPASHQKCHVL